MKIYKWEEKEGLTDLILSTASLKIDCQLQTLVSSFASSTRRSVDLYTTNAILASIGWNNNDDVFLREELYAAKATPIYKKFNYNHNEKDIIGVITNSYLIDSQAQVIPESTLFEQLPEQFDLAVSSVIYKKWEDPILQTRADRLIAEIEDNKWFVSMEVLFPSFDYAISKGEEKYIIERSDETSFLTKHLRAYKGSGEFEGWQVGRALRNMFFSGKGLVQNPANKRSTFLFFNGAKASNIFNNQEVQMSFDPKDYEKAVAELGATKQALESVQNEKNSLKEQLDKTNKDLDAASAISKEKSEKISSLENAIASKDSKIEELSKSLAEIIKAAKQKDRVAKLIGSGLEEAKANEIVQKFADASDEMFEEVVSLHKVKASTKTKEETEIEQAKASEDVSQEVETQANEVLESSKAFLQNIFKTKTK